MREDSFVNERPEINSSIQKKTRNINHRTLGFNVNISNTRSVDNRFSKLEIGIVIVTDVTREALFDGIVSREVLALKGIIN